MENIPIRPPKKGTAEYLMYDEFARSLTKDLGEVRDQRMTLLEWAMTYRANLTPDRRFDLNRHKYLKAIYGEEKSSVRVIYKASQLGASEYAISYGIHGCDIRNATVLYVFPTDAHVSDFSSARIAPAIEASDYLMRIVVDWKNTEGKKGADRVTLKRIRNRFMYLRGSQVKSSGLAPQLKSIDADILIMDEIDEMNPKAPAIAGKRTGHSMIAEQLWISTPTYAGFGIHSKWMESDQCEWFIQCPHCNHRQYLTIDNCIIEWDELERPVMWNGHPNDAWLSCAKCDKKLDRLANGEWVPTYTHSEIRGWHLTKMFSPLANIYKIVKSLESTDETTRKEIFNQDLGLPFSPRGGRITKEVLDKCIRDYSPPDVPKKKTFMGVDVGNVLTVIIREPADEETGERRLVYAGIVDTFLALGNLIYRYNVGICVIDALPETRKAREVTDAFPSLAWVAYYVGERMGTKKPEELEWDRKKRNVFIDRTRLIDTTFARFYSMENVNPPYAPDIKEYYNQLISPVRIIDDGIARYINSQPDHYAHAETYCTAASLGRRPDPFGENVNYSVSDYINNPRVTRTQHRSIIERRKLRSLRR
jgi:hypothetical protein